MLAVFHHIRGILINVNNVRYYSTSTRSMAKMVETSITQKIIAALSPTHLEVINESYMHNVPKGSETHFKVFVVSEDFNELSLINRHKRVHEILKDELSGSVHALSITAKTPQQYEKWTAMGNSTIEKSPPCLGGFGK